MSQPYAEYRRELACSCGATFKAAGDDSSRASIDAEADKWLAFHEPCRNRATAEPEPDAEPDAALSDDRGIHKAYEQGKHDGYADAVADAKSKVDDDYEAGLARALEAAFPGLPDDMTIDEAKRRVKAGADAYLAGVGH